MCKFRMQTLKRKTVSVTALGYDYFGLPFRLFEVRPPTYENDTVNAARSTSTEWQKRNYYTRVIYKLFVDPA